MVCPLPKVIIALKFHQKLTSGSILVLNQKKVRQKHWYSDSILVMQNKTWRHGENKRTHKTRLRFYIFSYLKADWPSDLVFNQIVIKISSNVSDKTNLYPDLLNGLSRVALLWMFTLNTIDYNFISVIYSKLVWTFLYWYQKEQIVIWCSLDNHHFNLKQYNFVLCLHKKQNGRLPVDY